MTVKLARRPVVIAVAVAGLAVTGAGVAQASIPDSAQTYTGCMLNNVGTLRLIDPSLGSHNPMGHCFGWETQVTWNQKGQPGAPGPTGPAGPTGPTSDRTDRARRADRGSGTLRACRSTGTIRAQG